MESPAAAPARLEPHGRRSPFAATTPRSAYADGLDEHDLRLPPSRADLYRQNDHTAARVVDAGDGMQAVIEITGLRTAENALRLIDPAILKRALQNDAAAAAATGSAG